MGSEPVVVIGTARRRGDHLTLRVITSNGRLLSITAQDLRDVPATVGQIRMPSPFNPQSKAFRNEVVAALQRTVGRKARKGGRQRVHREPRGEESLASELPPPDGVAGCPDLAAHLRAASKADRVQRDLERAQRVVTERASSLADQLERVLHLLEDTGFLDGWSLTTGGELLCGIFHESDLVIADCLRAGLFDGLTPAQTAAMASVFVYERRGVGRVRQGSGRDRAVAADLPPRFPRALVERWFDVVDRVEQANDREAHAGLPLTRLPDPGFASVAHAWASGRDLDRVLRDEEITGGDFVRTVKALTDLLRQIALVAPLAATREAAGSAAGKLFRGVVAASSAPTAPPAGPSAPAAVDEPDPGDADDEPTSPR